jgi:uncharacterized protein YndB with AHSA1/START domain
MAETRFVYVTYISTTPEALFNALIDAKSTSLYWQHENVSDWKPGSRWEHRRSGERVADIVGKVIESSPPRRLIVSWAFPADEKDEKKHSLVTYEIEPFRDITRLTVTHDRLEPGSVMLEGITAGWPKVLSSLKTLIETGLPLPKLW